MGQLTEKEAEKLLEKEGFKLVKRAFARNKGELEKVESRIKFPWAMKASSSMIVHKAKMGGIKLNIQNLKDAKESFEELAKIKNFEEVLVQEMIKGTELIIGLKKTPEFSYVLMFGKGGTNVEKEKEVEFRVLPLTEREIDEMIKEAKIFYTLKKNKADIKKIKGVIKKVSILTKKYSKISEFEINPLFANENEAVVADARFLFED